MPAVAWVLLPLLARFSFLPGCFLTKAQRPTRMGFRSKLVLEKLGFDPWQRYDALLGRELPDELGQLASRLNRDGGVSLSTASQQSGSRWASHWPRWRRKLAR